MKGSAPKAETDDSGILSVGIARGRLWSAAVALLSERPLDFEEEHRRLIFGSLALISVPMLLLFGVYHILTSATPEGYVNLAAAVCILLSVRMLRSRTDGRVFYRGAIALFAVLLIYFGTINTEHGMRALWVFVFPSAAFFIGGVGYGALISGLVFLAWMAFFFLPTSLTGAAQYTSAFVVRFTACYLTIFFIALFFEQARHKYSETMRRQQRQLEQDKTELRASEERMRKVALSDELTGVANRRSILAQLEKEIMTTRRSGNPLSIALLDIDHFKKINDTFGHLAGDEVLVECVRRIGSTLRARDRLGRYGGEEFLLLLPETSAEGTVHMLERIRSHIAGAPFHAQGEQMPVTVSIGIATTGSGDIETDDLIACADKALYWVKRRGRNQVRHHSMTEDASFA